MTRTTLLRAALVGAGLALGGAMVAAAADSAQVIKDRKAGFKEQGDDFKAMKQAIDSGADVKALGDKAAYIVDWSKKFPSMFPPGTETGDGTHAKPGIWSDRAEFDKRAQALTAAAEKLQATAASGDKAAFAAQWKATAQVCGGCHKQFRYKIS